MMATDSLSYKHLRVQKPGIPSSPPSSPSVLTFFSISPPWRPQHPSFHQALSTNNRTLPNRSDARRTQDIQTIFDPETEYDSYPLRYGMPRPSWVTRRARRPLAQALQLVRHQPGTGLGVGVVATSLKRDSTLSALLRCSSLHQQQQQGAGDKANNDEGSGDLGNGSDMIHQNQENRDLKRRKSSPFSILRSPMPPHLLYKGGSDVAPQFNHRNAARPTNDKYGECDGLDNDRCYDQSQGFSPAVAKDMRGRSQDNAATASMDYDNDDDDLLYLALDLELQLKFHDGCLDFDEMKHSDLNTLYENTTLSNLRGALKSLIIVGVSSTAAVYSLLLIYKLAEDLYVFTAIKAVSTLLRLYCRKPP
ncbi:MAG: hypothetical protein JOS17DRAFT_730104 [Linnemannia elongata]|nr:MAG: hypothetical protein JOS17DRAFT_730104 [Linnemannia elongata]